LIDAAVGRKGLRRRCRGASLGTQPGGVRTITAAALTPYRVEAFNNAKASENKIHDDAVARRFGFGGGLVPGVDVYAYMAHQPVTHWGHAWLERGAAECRFQKPVYDGDIATVTATEIAQGLDLRVDSHSEICATGRASLPDRPPALPEPFAEPPLPPADRPPASEETLAVGTLLGIRPLSITRELVAQCVADLRETETLYLNEGLAHPVIIARTGNWALNHNVVLGPWMHVGSKLQHFAAVHIGDEISVRARVIGNYEHKGHRFVEADVLVLANEGIPVARIAHIAIWLPRQLAAA
jgi:acyl dehydratase